MFFRSNSELLDPWEVLFDDISLHRIIGEGAFGKVYKGELLKQIMGVGKVRKSSPLKTDKEQQQTKKGLTVAVKMLQSTICLCQLFITYKYSCTSVYSLLNRGFCSIHVQARVYKCVWLDNLQNTRIARSAAQILV